MARKYVNPNRVLGMESMPPDYEHGPFRGRHEHAHTVFGGEARSHLHEGDAQHYASHIRFQNGGMQILNRARFGLPPMSPVDDELPPGAALDKYPWAANWGSFLNAIRGDRDPQGAKAAIRNAWSERVPSQGGFLIPEKLRQQVLFYLASSIIRPHAMVIDAEALRTGLPYLDNPDQSGGQQGLGGIEFAITEESTAIPSTGPRFGRTVLDAKKIAALIEGVPNEMLEDASEAMGDLLGRIIGLGYGWFVDDLAINGNGVNEPEGLMFCPAAMAVTRTTGSEVLHKDVVAMLKALHPASKATARWLASEDTFDFLLELYETVGTAPSGQQIPPPGTLRYNSQTGQWELMGLGIEVSDHQPQIGTPGDLMLCDLSLYVLAERQAMEVELSSQGSGFVSGTTNVRIKGRLDGRFWPRQTYKLRNGRTCSPLVVLQ